MTGIERLNESGRANNALLILLLAIALFAAAPAQAAPSMEIEMVWHRPAGHRGEEVVSFYLRSSTGELEPGDPPFHFVGQQTIPAGQVTISVVVRVEDGLHFEGEARGSSGWKESCGEIRPRYHTRKP